MKEIHTDIEMTAVNVPMKEIEDRKHFEDAIKSSTIQNDLWLQNNLELIMFYVTKFMTNHVYEVKSQNAYVFAEIDKEELYLHQVISPQKVDLDKIIAAFGKNIKRAVLGFTPIYKEDYQVREMKGNDTTLFVKGEGLEIIEKNYLRIPSLAHT